MRFAGDFRSICLVVSIFYVSIGGVVGDDNLAGRFLSSSLEDRQQIFLEATSLGELGIEQRDLEATFQELVVPAIDQDSDLAVQLTLKTGALLRHEERHNGGWFSKSTDGQTHLGRWLGALENSQSSREICGFKIRLFHCDERSEIPFDGRESETFRLALQQSFVGNGGSYQPQKAMDLLSEQLISQCGNEGEMRYLIPYAASLFPELSPWQRSEIVEWAERLLKADPDHDVASAIWVGFGIKSLGLGDRGILTSVKVEELLKDSDLTNSWRTGFAAMLADSGTGWSDQISIAAGQVISEMLFRGSVLSGDCFHRAMGLFLSGDEALTEWRDVGQEILNGWADRNKILGATAPNHYWCTPMMDLACRLGNEEMIDWNLLHFRKVASVAHGMVVSLVREGYYQRAQKLLFEECVHLSYRSHRFVGRACYDDGLDQAIPGLLSSIEDLGDRQFAALFLAGVPDSTSMASGSSRRISDRIHQVYEEMKPLVNQAESRNARIFEWLTLGRGHDSIERLLAKYQLGLDACVDRHPMKLRPDWAVRVELADSRRDLSRGNTFPWLFNWGRACFEENEVIAMERSTIASAMVEAIEYEIRKSRSDRQKHNMLLKLARKMLKTLPQDVHPEDLHRLAVTLLCSHALSEEMDAYHEWWTSLDLQNQRFYRKLLIDRRELVDQMSTQLNPSNLPAEMVFHSAQVRRRFVELVSQAEVVDSSGQGTSLLAYTNYRNLLTDNDVSYIAEKVGKKSPRGGSAWREWLVSLASQGRLEDALEATRGDQAVDGLGYVMGIEHALILEALGRSNEAVEMIFELQQSEFEGDLPSEYRSDILEVIHQRLIW